MLPPDLAATFARLEAEDATLADFIRAVDAKALLWQHAREASAAFEETAKAFLERHGEQTFGPEGAETRWYLGTTTKHKPRNAGEVVLALVNAAGGDLDAIAEALSSDPFKVTGVRSVLERGHGAEGAGVLFAELFESKTEVCPTTGKPRKRPQSMPAAFAKKGKGTK